MLHMLKIAKCSRLLSEHRVIKHVRGLAVNNVRTGNTNVLCTRKDEFELRHIGPREEEQLDMLRTIGFKVLQYLKT